MRFDAQPIKRRLLPLQVEASDIEAWLVAKDPTAIGSYDSIGREEYQRSFTAARTAGAGVVDDLYFGLVDTLSRGGTDEDFSKLVTPILKQKGWLGGDGGAIATRVSLIYDTNLRLARSNGRWDRYQATKAAFPYLRAITAEDDRVRHPPKSASDHTAWDGIILPVDHPFWTTYWPPLGFRCRCGIIQMSRSQLARYKGGVTSDDDLDERIARLGPPVFASPVQPIAKQLADMVAPTNANPMPGMPAIDPTATADDGTAAWDAVKAQRSFQDVINAIAGLFGETVAGALGG
jgi:SPP1 gp7 family putative phage head morphogenesis protein